jgi:type IV pilus assembly protein PilB
MNVDKKKLETYLVDTSVLSKEEFASAKKKAGKGGESLTDILVTEGYVSEEDMRRTIADLSGTPYVDLQRQKIPFEILSQIPEPIARAKNIVAYKKMDKNLEVAMLDTADIIALDFISKKTGLKILPRLTNTASIKHVLVQYQKSLKAEFGDLIQTDAKELKQVNEEGEEINEQELKKLAQDLPVVRIVNTLLKHAVIQNASDIHIEPLENQVVVRYRVDGILRDAMTLPRHASASLVARIKVLSSLKLDEKRVPQDGRFKIELDNEKVSFRVSTLPVYYGEKVVMRLLRENVSGFTLEKLGFHGVGLECIHNAMRQKTGIILATGPTGSGKSTTLYTLLDQLNTPDINISTIEDPVEYQMKRINQTQVKPDIGFSFAGGLRALMRQDPDVIMVGEIRDGETAGLAINAALTGHLVLSTLHTNSASGAVPRLVDMGAESFLLVSTLRAVIGQRLLRKLTDDKEKRTLNKAELEALSEKVDIEKIMKALYEEEIVKKGTKIEEVQFCYPNVENEFGGYKGRVGIHEILPVTESIKELIIAGASEDKIEKQAKKEGMMTMIEDGIFKAVQGVTSIDEVLRVVSE